MGVAVGGTGVGVGGTGVAVGGIGVAVGGTDVAVGGLLGVGVSASGVGVSESGVGVLGARVGVSSTSGVAVGVRVSSASSVGLGVAVGDAPAVGVAVTVTPTVGEPVGVGSTVFVSSTVGMTVAVLAGMSTMNVLASTNPSGRCGPRPLANNPTVGLPLHGGIADVNSPVANNDSVADDGRDSAFKPDCSELLHIHFVGIKDPATTAAIDGGVDPSLGFALNLGRRSEAERFAAHVDATAPVSCDLSVRGD